MRSLLRVDCGFNQSKAFKPLYSIVSSKPRIIHSSPRKLIETCRSHVHEDSPRVDFVSQVVRMFRVVVEDAEVQAEGGVVRQLDHLFLTTVGVDHEDKPEDFLLHQYGIQVLGLH